MNTKNTVCAVSLLTLGIIFLTPRCSLCAAVPPAQSMDISFDGAPGAYSDIYADLPAGPAVPAPAGPLPAASPYPLGQAKAWEDYFWQLGGMVKPGGLADCGLNKLQLLVDGPEVMRAAGPDLRGARSFIHIEIFQWQADEIGAKLRDLLAAKVKAGVRVRIMLDRLGSSLMVVGSRENKFVDSMRDSGIEVKVRPFELLHLDHRKVIVMDDGAGGLVGYTGGMNIGEDYQLNWHDQQTRVTGPAVAQLHRSFIEKWKKSAGEELSGFPEPRPEEGGVRTYVITHKGGGADHNIKSAYILAINTARDLIRIEDPYFTDRKVIEALIKAAADPRRPGLKVQLIVPAKNDMQITLSAFRSHYKDMLKAGIEIYEYQPRMEHLKVAVMDHLWATVGSSNLDPQSLRYNNEMNLLVLDREFAAQLDTRIFDKDIAQSLRITSAKFDLGNAIAGHLPFLSPQTSLPVDLAGL